MCILTLLQILLLFQTNLTILQTQPEYNINTLEKNQFGSLVSALVPVWYTCHQFLKYSMLKYSEAWATNLVFLSFSRVVGNFS